MTNRRVPPNVPAQISHHGRFNGFCAPRAPPDAHIKKAGCRNTPLILTLLLQTHYITDHPRAKTALTPLEVGAVITVSLDATAHVIAVLS